MFARLARVFFWAARRAADASAVQRAWRSGSPLPIVKRGTNKAIGRNVVRRLWWR